MAKPPKKTVQRKIDQGWATIRSAMIAAYVSIATAMGGFAGTAYVNQAQRDHEFRLKQCEWASTIIGNTNVPAALTERAVDVMSRCLGEGDV